MRTQAFVDVRRAALPPSRATSTFTFSVTATSTLDGFRLWTSYMKHAAAIYDTTTFALVQKPSRRFVSAENVFFARWWRQKPAQIKDSVRQLVLSGRLQFVGGGWTQNDEAVTHYTAIIDQMTLGLRFLNSTFGPQCGSPSVAWQADPFGHSVTQAALSTRMGFSSVMLGRISSDTKNDWQRNRSMEFVWETDSREQGESAS
ncbi:lysosomal alpha-mannosidase-like isoform X2 [Dermacentor albipictus]|uniref:lysosomal alpha-mannosidase-like isoform X2 n=1 Tax=Dermacentor albipictus TaxID=60249 RepID=UPI0031FC1B4A